MLKMKTVLSLYCLHWNIIVKSFHNRKGYQNKNKSSLFCCIIHFSTAHAFLLYLLTALSSLTHRPASVTLKCFALIIFILLNMSKLAKTTGKSAELTFGVDIVEYKCN